MSLKFRRITLKEYGEHVLVDIDEGGEVRRYACIWRAVEEETVVVKSFIQDDEVLRTGKQKTATFKKESTARRWVLKMYAKSGKEER